MWHLHLHGICLQCEHGHGMLPWPVGSAAALDDEALGAAVVSAFFVGSGNKHRTLDSAEVLDDDVPELLHRLGCWTQQGFWMTMRPELL